MGSVLYGTDISVGVGTKHACYDSHEHSFVSIIGLDKNSWGYSYTGHLHHNDTSSRDGRESPTVYATRKWEPGSIIGVHLDRWSGIIEFYLDRVPLGIAFRDLPKTEDLYPLVSSTAAKSRMSLLCAQSYPCNLSFDCVRRISQMCIRNRGRNANPCKDMANKTSLLATNNMALLLNNGPNSGKNIASLNEMWIRLLPPGIQSFIARHCWYIVGAREIKSSCKRLKSKYTSTRPEHNRNHYSDQDNSTDSEDSRYCDMNITDDEDEVSNQIPCSPQNQKCRIKKHSVGHKFSPQHKRSCHRIHSPAISIPPNLNEYALPPLPSVPSSSIAAAKLINDQEHQEHTSSKSQQEMINKSLYLAKQCTSVDKSLIGDKFYEENQMNEDSSDEDENQKFFGYTTNSAVNSVRSPNFSFDTFDKGIDICKSPTQSNASTNIPDFITPTPNEIEISCSSSSKTTSCGDGNNSKLKASTNICQKDIDSTLDSSNLQEVAKDTSNEKQTKRFRLNKRKR